MTSRDGRERAPVRFLVGVEVHMACRLLSATILIAWATTALGQQIYKWIDEKGVTQYTTTPPPGGKAQPLKSAPASSGRGTEVKSWKEQEIEFRARQVESAEAQQKQEQAEIRARQDSARREAACGSAQRNLRSLQEQRPVYTVDAKGERQYLDDAQRAEAMRKSKAFIDTECLK